jgi:DNA-binding HxlR family transcriptional regulator
MRPKTYRFNLQNKLSAERERRMPSPLNSMDTSYTGRVSRVVELLQGKWTVQILCAMRTRPVRLSELKRAIPSASKKALTASLRSLEAAHIILRRDLSSSVLHVEYELVDAMREPLVMLLDHLAEWGKLYDSEERSRIASLGGQIRMS